jgi:hypothetical protein
LPGNDHVIEHNLVENVLQECWDCGAYHTGRDLTWRGNIIRCAFSSSFVAAISVFIIAAVFSFSFLLLPRRHD